MNGRVEIEDTAGGGTTVVISLNAADGPGGSGPHEVEQSERQGAQGLGGS
jgi:hypothetical protein